MNYPQNAEIEVALLDVRKAYRLLHDYQRLTLDSLNYIGKQLGMTYDGGWPKFSAPTPRPGRGKLDNWAWDWLTLVFHQFHFHREAETGRIEFSVLLFSDTGFFCAEDENLDYVDIGGFLPPEESATKLGFLLTSNSWPSMEFLDHKEDMKTFLESGGGLPPELAAQGLHGTVHNHSRLATEDETNRLINDIIAWAADPCGIKLERVGKQ